MNMSFITLLYRKRNFSLKNFGPGLRTQGVIDHIKKELVEIEKAPTDVMEWVDVIALAIDGALRTGVSPERLYAAICDKQQVVEDRKYPDWRTADPTKGIEHIRE